MSTGTPTVRVIARLVAQPESIEALKSALNELVAPVRQQSGCLQYELLQDQANPTHFVFLEAWETQAALDAHAASSVMQMAGDKISGLLAAPAEICLYQLLA
jgi:quinol monooxygenase YgiN